MVAGDSLRRVALLVVAVLLAGLSPVGASSEKADVDPLLRVELAQKPTALAILVLEPGTDESVLSTLQNWGMPVRPYPELHMAALVLTREKVEDVAGLPGVDAVYRNEVMRPALDKSAPYIGAKIVWDTYKVRGDKVGVLVVDTGVDGSHPDVRYGQNLAQNVAPTRVPGGLIAGYLEGVASSDTDGHGTHVAGIVGGTSVALGPTHPDAGRYRGIAYEADLIGFQAGLPDPATGESSFDSVTVLEAFNYALAKQKAYNIRVVSNSWGSNGAFDPQSPINLATLNLYQAGLVVTFAAGNEGAQGAGTLNRYAVAPWVLGVAAGNYLNQRAPFSSLGNDPAADGKPYDHPDIMAPGVQINAAKAATDSTAVTGLLGAALPRDLYTVKSGTSMATPHVSGAAALLLSQNPKLSPDDVMDILVASSTPSSKVPVWEGGAGYLNALEAYRLAQDVPGGLDTFLQGKVKYAGRLTGDADFSEDAVSVGLHNGTARELGGTDTSLPDFARSLVGTQQGLTFASGTVLLTLLAFRLRRDD